MDSCRQETGRSAEYRRDKPEPPVLIDVTRLIAHGWAKRQPTGIDRVCNAYWRHFHEGSRAVVQHRGLIRVLSPGATDDLRALLDGPQRGLRSQVARLLSAALVSEGATRDGLAGMAYLNVGHTDFDLSAHHKWVRQQRIRPFYFVHDLIPVLHPEYSRPHAVRRHRGRLRGAMQNAAGIILSTNAVADDLRAYAAVHRLPLPPLAVAAIAGEALSGATPMPPAGIVSPFFLCVGTIEPRKNHRLLFDVWRHLAKARGNAVPRLIIAGQTGPMTRDLLGPLAADPVLRAHIEHRPACTDAELAQLLHHAAGLLVPSRAEGFGLPFVEALQAGTPVIASDLPVFREIGQGAARLVDPADVSAWAEAISEVARAGDPGRKMKPVFVPPAWPDHFAAIERFIAAPADQTQPDSRRVLAA